MAWNSPPIIELSVIYTLHFVKAPVCFGLKHCVPSFFSLETKRRLEKSFSLEKVIICHC